MKFIRIFFISILSTSLAVINRHFLCKTRLLTGNVLSKSLFLVITGQRFKDEAAKLRQEASDLELTLREEARAKGVPEQMINKLIPIRAPVVPKLKENYTNLTANNLSANKIRSNLGYLNTGDAVNMTSQLERIKSNYIISKWNSKNLEDSRFAVSNYQLKAKTNIEPANLKMDDVGFNYQNVLGVAVAVGTVCGLSANAVGGELGFLLGYSSALFPVIVLGIGSIAPGVIGEALYRFKLFTNEETRK
jgi:hypothetical protein